MSNSKPPEPLSELYEFSGSCWANVPKLAISETGYKDGDFEFISIVLAEGENFNPDFLKVNPKGTVPTLVSNGQTFTDSTTVVKEIIRLAPHPPQTSASASTSIIEEIHGESHDPNATLIIPVSEEDLQKKKDGLAGAFIQGKQKGLDKYLKSAPAEYKDFLEQKDQFNKQLLDLFFGSPDQKTKEKFFHQGQELWNNTGLVIRGVVTQAINKTPGPFAGRANPSQVDYHIITWLARVISNTGVEPGSPASTALPRLQKWTGGHEFDPAVAKYWDAWVSRDSFKKNNIH